MIPTFESGPQSLAFVRRQLLLSQRDLADMAGVTSSTIYLLEVGKHQANLKTMRAICEALGGISPANIIEFRESLLAKAKARER